MITNSLDIKVFPIDPINPSVYKFNTAASFIPATPEVIISIIGGPADFIC